MDRLGLGMPEVETFGRCQFTVSKEVCNPPTTA